MTALAGSGSSGLSNHANGTRGLANHLLADRAQKQTGKSPPAPAPNNNHHRVVRFLKQDAGRPPLGRPSLAGYSRVEKRSPPQRLTHYKLRFLKRRLESLRWHHSCSDLQGCDVPSADHAKRQAAERRFLKREVKRCVTVSRTIHSYQDTAH